MAEKNSLSILGITQIETRKEEKFSMKNACLKVEIVRLMVGTFRPSRLQFYQKI